MNLWMLETPRDYSFACFHCHGAWEATTTRTELCPECTAPPLEVRRPPLVLEWEAESDVVGDFSWTLADVEVVVTGRIREELASRFVGLEFWPVKMTQDPKLKRPKRPTKRTKPRIWLPYEGPPLWELRVADIVPLDTRRSTVRLVQRCATCGSERYEVPGVESFESRWNKRRMDLDHIHNPRVPGQGLYVRKECIEGRDFLSVSELPWWVLCTNKVKRFIESRGYTNVRFLEVGDVI